MGADGGQTDDVDMIRLRWDMQGEWKGVWGALVNCAHARVEIGLVRAGMVLGVLGAWQHSAVRHNSTIRVRVKVVSKVQDQGWFCVVNFVVDDRVMLPR